MFYYDELFLKEDLCSYVINWFEESWDNLPTDYKKVFRKTKCIMLNRMISNPDDIPNVFKKIWSDINYHGRKFDERAYVNHIDIVKWPTGENQATHKDVSIYNNTSIVYLNDNFDGGETRINDMIIKPKTGKIITFSGSEYEHEVFEVKNGNRYTIAAWYGNDDSSSINSQSVAYKKAIQDQQEYKNG